MQQQLRHQCRGMRAHPSRHACLHSLVAPARVLNPVCRHHRARHVAAAAGPSVLSISDALAKVQQLQDMTAAIPDIRSKVQPARFPGDVGDRLGFVAGGDVAAGAELLVVPEQAAITRIDAEQHELVGQLASDTSELVALTLWLCAERQKGTQSAYHPFLSTLPAATFTPLLWSDQDIDQLLLGSAVQAEARSRKAALIQQWQQLQDKAFSSEPANFPTAHFGQEAFMAAFSVVLAHALYLPSASCFALVPMASQLGRTASESGCSLDYDATRQAVVVTSPRLLRNGNEVQLYDPRPNSELLLATGSVPDSNPANFVLWDASLIQADRYFMMKAQILESLGFNAQEQFPVYADRFPQQLLAYLRLSRVADPALFAKVSFESDVQLSQMNEYEILQLIMGDCREKLAVYTYSLEEDVKMNQRRDLRPEERLAVKLRLSEKRIISATMDAVRRRLAPIRGIPTKTGAMQDPNSDLKEIFDAFEAIPSAPGKLVGGFLRWARGEDDPDWGKKPSDKPKAPRPW